MVETRAGIGRPGRFAALLGLIDPKRPILLQTHDYPDIDAVASAWAFAELLRRRGFSVALGYRGEIRSRSLMRLIAEMGMTIDAAPSGVEQAQVIVVDGSPTNGNVELFPGGLLGIVDHHRVVDKPDAPFIDIRPDASACATIMLSYWAEAGEELPRDLATALLAGLQSDTDFLSRRASSEDFDAYVSLFKSGDWDRASRIVRSVLNLEELDLIRRALGDAEVRDSLFYTTLPGPCGQEVLAVLAEFVLRAEELAAAVVVETSEGGVHLSARSKASALSAFDLVRRALRGIGSGGGHSHAAGGVVPASAYPGPQALKERFFAVAAQAAQHS